MQLHKWSAVASLVAFIAWFFLPQIEVFWLTEDELVLSAYSGLGSLIALPPWIGWALLLGTIGVFGAIVFFGDRVKWIAIGYFIVGTAFLGLPGGFVVESALSAALSDSSTFFFGIAVGGLLAGARPMRSLSSSS